MTPAPDPLAVVREEALELVADLEAALLELEDAPGSMEAVDQVFRLMHTIKGSATMYGVHEVARLAHEVETLFHLVREGALDVSRDLLDLALRAKDLVGLLYQSSQDDSPPGAVDSLVVDAQLMAGPALKQAPLLSSSHQPVADASAEPASADTPDSTPDSGADPAPDSEPDSAPAPEPAPPDPAPVQETFALRFKPHGPDVLVHMNPLAVLDELRGLGELRVTPHAERLDALAALEPEGCPLWWELLLTTDQGEDAVRDVFIFVDEYAEVAVERVEHGDNVPAGSPGKEEARESAALAAPGAGERSGSARGGEAAWCGTAKQPAQESSLVGVDSFKLDDLVALVGELVTAQAQLNRIAAQCRDPELAAVTEDMDRLSSDLRDRTLSLRMQPVGVMFERFRGLVRDLAPAQGKDANLETRGAETELDRTVMDQLAECLAHLLANCVEHGLETPGERRAAGKPSQGRILIEASHSGGSVLVRIVDDGRGLDREAIGARGVERGIIERPETMSDKEIFDLVFHPGFSASRQGADEAGSDAGPNVSMDQVKASIESMRGSVELASEPGQGTTISVRMPLTLAIIEGLLVRVGAEHYVIPLTAVQECVELPPQGAESRGRVMSLRNELVPYVRLRDWFQVPGPRPDIEQVIVTGDEDSRTGIVVDEVVGQQQTVVKNLGRVFQHVEEFSGATVRGDGTMALILDVDHLVRKVRWESRRAEG